MKNSLFLALGLIAALGVAGIVTTSAQAAPKRPLPTRGKPAPPVSRIGDRIGLTPDQRMQIREILQAEKETIMALLADLRDTRELLREAIRSENATEESVREASAVVAAVEADIAVERAFLYRQIRPVLTEEQLARLAELEAKADEFVTDVLGRIGERLAE